MQSNYVSKLLRSNYLVKHIVEKWYTIKVFGCKQNFNLTHT